MPAASSQSAGAGAAPAAERETLAVGYLPVTCHLTCPVTDFASKTSRATRFESQRFTDFPTIVETLKSGRLQATFMIAPLAMKLREQGVKVKIAYLGHRDGSTVMVRSDLPAKSLKDLEGRSFALPSKYSNQNLVIRKLMADQGVDPAKIRFVEMPPPDMPGRPRRAKPSTPTSSASRTRRARSWMDRGGSCITRKTSGRGSSRACWWSPRS